MPSSLSGPVAPYLKISQAARVIFIASAAALIFAFVMQYGFNYEPCVLCLWQRVPFAAALILAGLACARPLQAWSRALLALCGVIFIVSAGLAIFHTGVERHWWLGTAGCAVEPLKARSITDLRTQLLHMVSARCDEISWTFLGLSMANYNIAYSLALAVFSLGAAKRIGK